YNPWLKFKGGRGLATGAGGTALLFPFVLVLWLILWAIIYLMKKNIHFANIWSSIMCLIIVFTSTDVAAKYTFPHADVVGFVILFSMGLFIIILTKHIEPLIELIEKPNIFKRKKEDE
ncbi:MAG: glycerol-3-phosphate acyltransferase, partial [Ignavibacteriaceae bacterium]|nr:glycerol-3-phosphate acyltransferase [Ignavibacteriaceae bacterium]